MSEPDRHTDARWNTMSVPADDLPALSYLDPNEITRLYGPRFQRNPMGLYREMRRRHGPVAPVLLDGDVPAWLVLGYRELHFVTSNPDIFGRDSRRWNAWDRIPPDWPLLPVVGHRPSVLYTEGEEHHRRAGAISDVLAAVDQFELRTTCERIADQLIDGFAGRGEAELMDGYAHRMPLLTVAALLGFPEAETPSLMRDIFVTLDNGEDAVGAHERVAARTAWLLDQCRLRPGPDIPSRLAAHPVGLTDDEIREDLMVLLAAAQQNTAYWIGNTLRLMLTDARFAVTISGGRRSIGQALNEVLWEDTPTQIMTGRWAVRSTTLGGQRIQSGDMIVLGLAAANADPQIRPDSYDGPGGNHAYMSFSHGEHRCPYPAQEIAEVVTRTAVEILLDRLPDLTLAVPADALVWRPTVWMRGLTALPVEFTPTA